jgi:hypothetical protein
VPETSTLDESYRRQFQEYTFIFKTPGDTVSSHITFDPSLLSRHGLDSLLANGQRPPQQVFLVPNDLKPPKSDQFSVGVRHDFGGFNGSVSYNGSRGFNGYTYEWATAALDANGNCCSFHNVPAYSDVLVGNNDVKTWYNAMYLTLNRPYQRSELNKWGWGAGVAYTLSKAEQDGGDLFSFPQLTSNGNPRHPTSTDQRHNIVANFITDIPYLWGIQFSGLMTLGSGLPFNLNSNPTVAVGIQENLLLGVARTPWQKNVDLRLEKDFLQLHGNSVGVTLSVFNVFNTQNLTFFDGTECRGNATVGSCDANSNFGHAGGVITDGRRIQLGATYSFK